MTKIQKINKINTHQGNGVGKNTLKINIKNNITHLCRTKFLNPGFRQEFARK